MDNGNDQLALLQQREKILLDELAKLKELEKQQSQAHPLTQEELNKDLKAVASELSANRAQQKYELDNREKHASRTAAMDMLNEKSVQPKLDKLRTQSLTEQPLPHMPITQNTDYFDPISTGIVAIASGISIVQDSFKQRGALSSWENEIIAKERELKDRHDHATKEVDKTYQKLIEHYKKKFPEPTALQIKTKSLEETMDGVKKLGVKDYQEGLEKIKEERIKLDEIRDATKNMSEAEIKHIVESERQKYLKGPNRELY